MTKMLREKLRGIKIVDSSKTVVPDSDSSNDEDEDKILIRDDPETLKKML